MPLKRYDHHVYATRLYTLLRRARPEETSAENLGLLEDLTKRCDPCQRIQRGPTRFRVSFGAEDTLFNERVLIDVMYLDGTPIYTSWTKAPDSVQPVTPRRVHEDDLENLPRVLGSRLHRSPA